jgi:restriction system protein
MGYPRRLTPVDRRRSPTVPVPNYEQIMLPLLAFAGDGNEHSIREAVPHLADQFALTEAERNERIRTGQKKISHRTGWAKFNLKKAGLLEDVRHGIFRITDSGAGLLQENPSAIDTDFLMRFPAYVEFREAPRRNRDDGEAVVAPPPPHSGEETPEEALERAYIGIRETLAQDLLDHVKAGTPEFFENLVVELLVKMGYGGSRADAGERVGQTGDGGIDGIIKEDRLGLDVIYLQAKRWQATVGRPEIQRFVGALQGHRARKGVFLTTSSFSQDAKEYVSHVDSKVVLIDGAMLSRLMLDFDLGVSTVANYAVKRIDSDYFEEE